MRYRVLKAFSDKDYDVDAAVGDTFDPEAKNYPADRITTKVGDGTLVDEMAAAGPEEEAVEPEPHHSSRHLSKRK